MTVPVTLVQKYGGSSLADAPSLMRVAQQMVARARQGIRLVVVVSAMGGTTSQLLQQAQALTPNPPQRELDMLVTTGERMCMALLCMAVHAAGGTAKSLTGSQSGIITDNAHQGARVIAVRPERIQTILNDGHIAVVAGYQGVSLEREITTLGRGGSDITAVALAAALGAQAVEIFSDVDGVYSADPRICPQSRHLSQVSYTVMADLAHFGAQVLHDQAVAFARQAGIEVWAKDNGATGGRGTVMGPTVALPRGPQGVSVVHRALHVVAPDNEALLRAWPDAAGSGLRLMAQGGAEALFVAEPRTPLPPQLLAADALGFRVRAGAVSAVTLVAQEAFEAAEMSGAMGALRRANIAVLAVFVGARSLTVAVAEGSAVRAVGVLHGRIPT